VETLLVLVDISQHLLEEASRRGFGVTALHRL
jgi:hypothetical protein